MFWTCVVHCLDMSGPGWDRLWTHFGKVLDNFWTWFRHDWDTTYTRLDYRLSCFKHILGMFRTCSDKVSIGLANASDMISCCCRQIFDQHSSTFQRVRPSGPSNMFKHVLVCTHHYQSLRLPWPAIFGAPSRHLGNPKIMICKEKCIQNNHPTVLIPSHNQNAVIICFG